MISAYWNHHLLLLINVAFVLSHYSSYYAKDVLIIRLGGTEPFFSISTLLTQCGGSNDEVQKFEKGMWLELDVWVGDPDG